MNCNEIDRAPSEIITEIDFGYYINFFMVGLTKKLFYKKMFPGDPLHNKISRRNYFARIFISRVLKIGTDFTK